MQLLSVISSLAVLAGHVTARPNESHLKLARDDDPHKDCQNIDGFVLQNPEDCRTLLDQMQNAGEDVIWLRPTNTVNPLNGDGVRFRYGTCSFYAVNTADWQTGVWANTAAQEWRSHMQCVNDLGQGGSWMLENVSFGISNYADEDTTGYPTKEVGDCGVFPCSALDP